MNQLNRHGDPGAGVNVSTAQVSGSIVQEYGGFEGGKLTVTNPWAVQKADPAVGPLYGGIYMYARLDPNATAPLARGQFVFWFDELNYIVTGNGQNPTTSAPNKPAGVALNATLPGYWDFFQITGIALVKMSGAGTIGQQATLDPTVNPATVTPDGDLTINTVGTIVLAPAVANAVSPLEVNLLQGYNF
jgi:hypothetical protein